VARIGIGSAYNRAVHERAEGPLRLEQVFQQGIVDRTKRWKADHCGTKRPRGLCEFGLVGKQANVEGHDALRVTIGPDLDGRV